MAAEALLGPLVPTLVFLPFVVAGLMGTMISFGAILSDSSRPLQERLFGLGPVVFFGILEVAAVIGLLSLWIVVLVSEDALRKTPRWRWSLTAGLVLGILAAVYWLGSMAFAESGSDLTTWIVWLAVLGGPIVVGLRRLRAILRGPPAPGG